MTFKNLGRAVFAAAVIASMTSAVYAQSSTQGALDGTVFDATNALVGKATVTITSNTTAATITLTSDDSGFFKAPLLEPGSYTVTIAAAGFETYKSANVQVNVGQATELMPHLITGAATSVVEVTSEAPVLNFDSPDFSANLNQRALENIPVNNLRWSSLALTTPGVVSDSNGFGLIAVRGISPLLNNVLIDGADDNQAYYSEERGRTREAYSTPPAAIAEFQVNTGVYQAQYGRAAGGVINSVTKSGGNSLHGQVYYNDRESSWGAFNPYTTNTVGTPNGSGGYNFVTSPYKPLDSRKIWGGTAGGAIIKDKLFWEYTFDQHHRNFPGTAKATSPSTFFTAPDANLPTGATCSLTTGAVTGTASTIDQQTCLLAAREGLSSYGAGYTAYENGLASLLTDLGSVPRFGDQEVNMAKLDYQISAKNHVSFLYNRLRWDSPGGVQTQSTNDYAVDTFGTDFVKLDYGVAKLSTLVSSHISNELLYQYGRELNDEGQQPFSAFTKQYLMGSGTSAGNVPEVSLDSPSSVGFFLGSPYYSYRKALPDERKWQIGDTLFYSVGNHSFKFGLDSVHNYDLLNNLYESNGYITYATIGNFLSDINSEGKATDACNSTAATTGAGVGNYPCYSSFVQGFGGAPVYNIATFDYGVFAQDNWKITPRLTLEIGVRYDYEQLPGSGANTSLTAPISTAATATSAAYAFTPFTGLTNSPSDKNNIGPRVGFAYDLFGTGKSVLRGGYGMYYGRIINGVLLNTLLNTGSENGQFTASLKPATFCNNTTVACTGTNTPANGAPVFPNVIANATPPKPSAYYLAPNLQNPMVHEYDMTLQQQLGKGHVLSLSYLGALGRDLTNFVDLNLNPAQTNATVTFVDPTGKGPVANGTQFVVPQYTSYGNTALFGANAVNFTSITEVASNINSNYNAFAVEIQNRSLHSIQYDVNYVWSHALDYDQNATTTTTTNNQYDPYGGLRSDYGNSNYNVPNRVAGYVLYNLPNTQRGDRALKYVVNDWSLDSQFQVQNGLPYSANITSSSYLSAGALNSSWNGAGGTSFIPEIGRNTFKYPRDIVQDLRVQKQVRFTERYSGEARLDLYNMYNHQNVTGVQSNAYAVTSTGNVATATYQGGQTTTAAFGTPNNSNSSGFLYTPREVQISFKFLF